MIDMCRPFWYAAGATIQVLLFAILAIHVKLKAPRAHTGVNQTPLLSCTFPFPKRH